MASISVTPPGAAATTRRAARNAAAIAVATLLSRGLLFGWQLLLARWLGEAAFGVYGTVGALMLVGGALANFGLGVIVIRDVARAPDQAGAYLAAALWWQTLLGAAAFVVLNVAAWALGYPPEVRAFAALAGVALLLDGLGNTGYDQLIAAERMVAAAVIETLHALARVLLAGALLLLGWGLLGVYAATVVTSAARGVALHALVWRGGVRPRWPVNQTAIGWPLLAASTPIAVSAFLTLSYQQADKLMSTALLGVVATGYLTAAVLLVAGVVELLSTTLLTATFPMLSRSAGTPGYGALVQRMAFVLWLAALPLAVGISVFAPWLVWVFGPAFAPTTAVLRVLVWYAPVTMLVGVLAQGMLVQGRQRVLLGVRAGGLAANVALNLALMVGLGWGVRGAALATVLAETLVLALLLALAREVGVASLLARVARGAVAAGVLAAALLLSLWVHPLLSALGGALAYGAMLLWGGTLRPDDWAFLRRTLAAVSGRG